MGQSVPMEPYEQEETEVADYRRQAREFLIKSRGYLENDDLRQAAGKGWGAAAWMAKAAAEAQGWQYSRHDEFFTVMYQAQDITGDSRLENLRRVANELRGFFYTRKIFLRPDVISRNLAQVELLLDLLQPLTEGQ